MSAPAGGFATPRGVRNNNPGNIRKSRTTWQGQAKSQPDASFVTFVGPEWGIRAMAKILLHYETEGLNTVAEIVRHWAPPVENDTGAYVRDVAHRVGVDQDHVLNLRDAAVMVPLLQALCRHEEGQDPYPLCTYVKAVQLAGLTVPRATDPARAGGRLPGFEA